MGVYPNSASEGVSKTSEVSPHAGSNPVTPTMTNHIEHLAKDGHEVRLIEKAKASEYSGMPLLVYECKNCGTKFEVIEFPKHCTYHLFGEIIEYDGTPTCSELTIKDIIT